MQIVDLIKCDCVASSTHTIGFNEELCQGKNERRLFIGPQMKQPFQDSKFDPGLSLKIIQEASDPH